MDTITNLDGIGKDLRTAQYFILEIHKPNFKLNLRRKPLFFFFKERHEGPTPGVTSGNIIVNPVVAIFNENRTFSGIFHPRKRGGEINNLENYRHELLYNTRENIAQYIIHNGKNSRAKS